VATKKKTGGGGERQTMNKFIRISFIAILITLLSIFIWVMAWRYFGDTFIKSYYINLINKSGGISEINTEAINIFDRIKLGFFFTDISQYYKELYPNIYKFGIVNYDYKSKEIPMHIEVYQGRHSHRYFLKIYDPRIPCDKIELKGIEINKNIRLIGWTWRDRFRF